MKTADRKLTAALAALVAACFLLAGAFALPVSAAEAPSAEGGFMMQEGASVRLEEGGSGIRFSATVTEEFYQALKTAYGENAGIEFHMVVGAGEDFGQPNDYVSEGVPSFGQSGEYVYREAIIYDRLEEDLTAYYTEQGKTGEELTALVAEGIEKAYKTELNAKAYVKVTPESGEAVTIDAVPADTLRSMQGVALAALVKGGYEENSEEETALKSYLGGELTVNRETALAGYFDAESTGTLTSEVGDGSYTAYFGAKKVGSAVVAEGQETVVIDGLSGFDRMTVGEDYPVTLYNEESGTAFVRDFKYVSKVIDEASDLAMFKIVNTFEGSAGIVESGLFDGYYVLGKDIDATGYTHANSGLNLYQASNRWFTTQGLGNCGLKGTFDGNGHTISNLALGQFGLFGLINGGTVKNVAIEISSMSGGYTAGLCWFALDAVIENVHLEVAELPGNSGRAALAASILQSEVNNVLIEVRDVLWPAGVEEYCNYGSFISMNVNTVADVEPNTFTNVYIISAFKATASRRQGEAVVYIDGENRDCENTYTGIKRYDTIADMIANRNYLGEEPLSPNDYSSFTECGCWHLSEDGIPVFGAN